MWQRFLCVFFVLALFTPSWSHAGSIALLSSNPSSAPAAVALTPSGQVACANNENSVAFYNMTTGQNISFRTASSLPSGVRQIAMSSTRAIFLRASGHFIFDVTNDSLTEIAANTTSAGKDVMLTVDGNTACINAQSSVAFYDMVAGGLISFVSPSTAPSGVRQIAVNNDRAIFLRSGGHYIMDTSVTPPTTVAANVHSTPGDVMLTPDGQTACINAGSSVAFYDMATGALISFGSASSSPSGVRQIAMNATRAIFLRAQGHFIYDISVSPPVQVSATVTSLPEDVMLTPDGSTACINTANSVAFYDMATGAFLGSRSMATPPHGVRQIAMNSNRAVFLRNGGNIFFDVTTSPPTEVLANVSSLSHDVELTPDGATAFIQTENAVVFYNMNTGALIDFHSSTPAAGDRSLVVTDTRAMALRTSGNAVFSICDVTGVGDAFEPRAILTPMFPNPMTASGSTLRYQVERTGPVSIEVYNATGRLQRTLVDQVMLQGSFEIYWDGRNREGVLVPNGVYYALVKGIGVHESSRVTVLR